ncbi:MAG: sortase, partial [Clostridia bacterium]|nr:sortase [Clostridia bacterium]
VRLADAFAPQANAAADAEYAAQLDPCGNGAMAVLEIPKLGASLPVYHGVSEAVLEKNVGHLPGTGLPVSGGAACVLAAENGTSAARLFSGLDRLIPGDCFYIRTLRETLVYQVEQAVETDADDLPDAALDADVCALMTRSAEGGSRRLVVLGRRIPLRAAPLQDDTRLTPDWTARLIFAAPALLAGLILLAAVETIRRAVERRRLKRIKL